jgi:hypothetical protein
MSVFYFVRRHGAHRHVALCETASHFEILRRFAERNATFGGGGSLSLALRDCLKFADL